MKIKYWFFLMIMMGACTDKYVVNTNTPASGYLVVEGFINMSGTTVIAMTRSSGVDTPIRVPEPGAQIEIQSQIGGSFPLVEATDGQYDIENLYLDPSQQYRLHIRTANGKEYLSDYTSAVVTPPIDDVGWTAGSGLVTIDVSTHDPQTQPGYYQWQFEETWKYHSGYPSGLKYENGQMVPRTVDEMFYYCYHSDLSTQIAIASTEKLSTNVIYQLPIQQISYETTNKLLIRYSILVKQYALTKDWYEWIRKIKKNTESTGSIFDAQPGETGGNIKCVSDPAENVIGFIGSATETEKRIFIDRTEIPAGVVYTGYENCSEDSIKNNPYDLDAYFKDQFNIPTRGIYPASTFVPTFYMGASAGCVDCRMAGGTTIPPPFWQ
jgi:Domain of unknown function (DUF4249)